MVSAASVITIRSSHDFEAALGMKDTATALVTPEEWEALLAKAASNVVFLTWQWQLTWWRHFGTSADCTLHLLALRGERGALLGIAPLFISREPIPPRKEYRRGEPRPDRQGEPHRVLQFVGGADVADYLDVIAAPEHLETVWTSVLDYVAGLRAEWDIVDFHSLPQLSASHEIVQQVGARHGLQFDVFPEDVCPVVELPDDWETFLMSLRKKDRHELRRKVRKLEGRDDVRWYLVPSTDWEQMQKGMEAFLTLHRMSGADKAHFMNEQMAEYFLDMAHDLIDTGWLDLAILEVDGEPASAYFSYRYGDRVYLYNSGYNPRFASYSAGVALLAYRMHKAILQGCRYFDFLRGDEPYKYDFGGQDTYVYRAMCHGTASPEA
jgi:CelD/BcsL family acetyltransferase involved in cellulose biosynthesis